MELSEFDHQTLEITLQLQAIEASYQGTDNSSKSSGNKQESTKQKKCAN